jgi:lysophospholipase L1-like esterase
MNRRTLRSALIAGAVAACCIASGTAADAATVPSPASANGFQPGGEYDYYLALGDSLAWGYQPDSAGHGVQSGHGYADDIAARLREHGNRNLQYVNLSCPGETTGTMLNGSCPDLAGSGQSYTVQEDAAVAFLAAHPHARILVTLDIGANNVDGCLSGGTLNATCVAEGVGSAATQLPEILAKLKAAAGRHVSFIGMNYYDPFLAEYLTGSNGRTLAEESVALSTTFNGVLGAGYAAFGVPVADVADAFQTTDFADTTSFDGMTVPVNVADVCEWTWMCAPAPVNGSSVSTSGMLGNIHCNDIGYEVIAQTFEALLPARHGEW